MLGIVWALVRGNAAGWASAEVIATAVAGVAALAAFVAWELRAPAPMLPMRFFRSRAFAAANAASLAMYFGMFGSVFLLTQFLQLVMGYSPLETGLRTLAWTAMPLVIAPAAGALSDRIGGRPIMAFGLTLDAIAFTWMAAVAAPDTSYGQLAPALVLAGIGTAAFFRPGRQPSSWRGPPRGVRPGLGSDERDPRDRRRPGHRRPRRRLREPGRLRDPEHVRGGLHTGGDDRCGHRCRRRRRRAHDPPPAQRRGAAPAGASGRLNDRRAGRAAPPRGAPPTAPTVR
jgi:hypothetical protein